MGVAGFFGLTECFERAACGVLAELPGVGGAGLGLGCGFGCGRGDVSFALTACSSGPEGLCDLDLCGFPMRGGRGGVNSHDRSDCLRGLGDLRGLGRLGGLGGSGDSDKYSESEGSSDSEYSDSDGDADTVEDRLVLGDLCGRGVRGILIVLTGLLEFLGFGRFADSLLDLLLLRDLCFRRCLVDEDSPIRPVDGWFESLELRAQQFRWAT
ncbi:hypothetical protein PG993_012359 [Apiospora rasikravindrae]|uniref:Uncharacterized protein n=1 Tax=Apiospora rasikravindrae TaxID=990691 RepID=A0ABR1S2P8_9PEZI